MSETQFMGSVSETPAESRSELESSINFEITEIAKNKKEIKKVAKEIKDRLLANISYAMKNDEVKAASRARTEAKKKAIANDPSISSLDIRLKSLRADNNMRQLSLSDYLVEFEKNTGQHSVSDSQGQLFEFETIAVLKTEGRV